MYVQVQMKNVFWIDSIMNDSRAFAFEFPRTPLSSEQTLQGNSDWCWTIYIECGLLATGMKGPT
jgi:hypothetical protein